MLKKYRNALYELIRAANLDPRKFTPEEELEKIGNEKFDGFCLFLENSSVYFAILTRFRDQSREFRCAASACEITANGPRGVGTAWTEWTDFRKIEAAFRSGLEARPGTIFLIEPRMRRI
jgi:hypothetical protein